MIKIENKFFKVTEIKNDPNAKETIVEVATKEPVIVDAQVAVAMLAIQREILQQYGGSDIKPDIKIVIDGTGMSLEAKGLDVLLHAGEVISLIDLSAQFKLIILHSVASNPLRIASQVLRWIKPGTTIKNIELANTRSEAIASALKEGAQNKAAGSKTQIL